MALSGNQAKDGVAESPDTQLGKTETSSLSAADGHSLSGADEDSALLTEDDLVSSPDESGVLSEENGDSPPVESSVPFTGESASPDDNTFATDEEEQFEITDRKFWETKSTPKLLGEVDKIFESMKKDFISGYELKYNKFYIGMAKDGSAKNFLMFKPKKNWLYIIYKGNEDTESLKKAEALGLDLTCKAAWKEYYLKLENYNQYQKHKDFIDSFINILF